MDLSIWDPPENPDESSYLANSWQYNLYYDPRLDVIEEDALNEKSCVQVLKILIKKADSEIAELEDDILMLQRQLACKDDMHFVELNKKIVNLDSMLRALKNEKEQRAEPGVQSSNLPEEDLNKTEAINDHSSKDIKTVEFKDGCIAQVNNTVLASLVQARNHQETPAGTTLEDRHVSEQEAKEYSSKPTQKRVKHVQIHDKRTSEQWVNTNMASIKAPCGIMEQEVVHTETDCTIEDTRPHLLNSERKCRSEPRKKLKRGGDSDVLHNVEVAFPMPSSIPSPRIPDINKMSLDQLKALAIQHNKYGVSIMRKEDLQQLLRSKLQAEVALPMSFNTPSPRIPDINEMSLVQLKELANQHNIYGVSIMQKTDLQQLLRSKLQAEVALPMSSSTPSPRIPDINKMSLVQLKASENQHNIYGVSNMRKEDLQQLLRSKLQAEVAFPMSSSTSSLRIPDINKMSLVQLRALANRHNIYGVSVMRKADLQQLLRSKLSAKHWS